MTMEEISVILARLHLIEERLKNLESNNNTQTSAQTVIYDAMAVYVESKRRYPKDIGELRPYLPITSEWGSKHEPVFENMKRQLKHKRSRHHKEITTEASEANEEDDTASA